MSNDKREEQDTSPERQWQLAQLTTQLVAEQLSKKFSQPSVFTEQDEPLVAEIEAAMSRAELILDLVENPRNKSVSLYRLFEEGEQMSESKLAERLAELQWTGTKKESIRGNLEKLKARWRERLDRREQLVSAGDLLAEEMIARVKETLGSIERDFDISHGSPEFSDWSNRIVETLTSQLPPAMNDTESQQISWEKEECLFRWCIDEKLGAEVKVSARRFRPHELFRYTEDFSWFPDPFKKRKLTGLEGDYQVGPSRPSLVLWFKEFQRQFWTTPAAKTYLEDLQSRRTSRSPE